jgi:hypothetical protein
MRYSIGLLDTLFGEKITLRGPDEKGKIVKLIVTRKWLEQAQGGAETTSPQEQADQSEYSASLI